MDILQKMIQLKMIQQKMIQFPKCSTRGFEILIILNLKNLHFYTNVFTQNLQFLTLIDMLFQ